MMVLIDNYDSFTYNLYQMLATVTNQEVLVKRNDAVTVTELEALQPSHIVLSPGPGRPDNAGICLEIVSKMSPTTPILGVCLGQQVIAQAFGGNIIQANDIVHGKACHIFHCGQHLFQDLPQPLTGTRYHSLMVQRSGLPSELMITAETHDGTIMGLRHNSYPCMGVQFHPESITSEEGKTLLQQFVGGN